MADIPGDSMRRLQGVHIEWDSERDLRARYKEQYSILREEKGEKYIAGSLGNIALNILVLMPILESMAIFGDLELPSVEEIKDALRKFYRQETDKSKWNELETNIHGDAVIIKRLLSSLKKKWGKPETPREPELLLL